MRRISCCISCCIFGKNSFILAKTHTYQKAFLYRKSLVLSRFLNIWLKIRLFAKMHLIGIEPTHAAPEATALSTELQMHLHYSTILFFSWQALLIILCILFLVKMQMKHSYNWTGAPFESRMILNKKTRNR